MTTGEKIRHFRNMRGISQEMLGQLSGINPATIKKYEYGIRNPKPDQLLKITNALGISINIFMDFDIETVSDVLSLLCTYLKAKRLQENIKNNKYNFDSQEQQEEALAAISADMEEIKSHLLDDSMIVKKGTHGLSVKMFP